MTDIFLYSSEPNPNDIKLSDPTVLRGGAVIVEGNAVLSAIASLVVSAILIVPTSVDVAGSGSVSATALVEVRASSTLAATGSLSGSAIVEERGNAAVTGSGSLTGSPLVEVRASSSLPGTGTLVGSAIDVVPGSVSLSGIGSLASSSLVQVHAAATQTAVGELSGNGLVQVVGHHVVSAGSLFVGNPLVEVISSAVHIGVSQLSADGDIDGVVEGIAEIDGNSSLDATGVVIQIEIPNEDGYRIRRRVPSLVKQPVRIVESGVVTIVGGSSLVIKSTIGIASGSGVLVGASQINALGDVIISDDDDIISIIGFLA